MKAAAVAPAVWAASPVANPDSYEGFKFQWRKAGVNIPGQTNSTYTVTNVQPTNAGIYSVVVSAPCRTVTVNSPAQITGPPVSQVSVRGSSGTFNVSAAGTALGYEWQRNGAVLSMGPTLTLNDLTTNSAGTYCVFVTVSG